MQDIDTISGDVVDLAIRIHRALGPGLLESVYETVLAAKLEAMGYHVARQQPVSIMSKIFASMLLSGSTCWSEIGC